MTTNLVVSGGPLHDFAATTGALVALAAAEGIRSDVPLDPTAALDRLVDGERWDLVTVDALLWRMPAARHAALRDGWSYRLTDRQGAALVAHVEAGGGLLACHTAAICFDGAPAWRRLLGAAWSWERSGHPPLGPVTVRPTAVAHPLIDGLSPFEVVDEVYADLDLDPGREVLLTSVVDGRDVPVLWTRTVGRGRVVVDLLGHGPASFDHPVHAEVLRRALRWLTAPAAHRSPLEANR